MLNSYSMNVFKRYINTSLLGKSTSAMLDTVGFHFLRRLSEFSSFHVPSGFCGFIYICHASRFKIYPFVSPWCHQNFTLPYRHCLHAPPIPSHQRVWTSRRGAPTTPFPNSGLLSHRRVSLRSVWPSRWGALLPCPQLQRQVTLPTSYYL
jgi:hypothetical protein